MLTTKVAMANNLVCRLNSAHQPLVSAGSRRHHGSVSVAAELLSRPIWLGSA